jgi:hypothetical protein
VGFIEGTYPMYILRILTSSISKRDPLPDIFGDVVARYCWWR